MTKPAVGQWEQIHDLMTEEVRGGCRKVLETIGPRKKKQESDREARTRALSLQGTQSPGIEGRRAGGLSGDRQAVPF